jgi:hypothetical protein
MRNKYKERSRCNKALYNILMAIFVVRLSSASKFRSQKRRIKFLPELPHLLYSRTASTV